MGQTFISHGHCRRMLGRVPVGKTKRDRMPAHTMRTVCLGGKGQGGAGSAGGKGCPEAHSFALPGLSFLFPVKRESKSKANSDKEKPFVPE